MKRDAGYIMIIAGILTYAVAHDPAQDVSMTEPKAPRVDVEEAVGNLAPDFSTLFLDEEPVHVEEETREEKYARYKRESWADFDASEVRHQKRMDAWKKEYREQPAWKGGYINPHRIVIVQ